MGGIEDHGAAERLELGQAAVIHHQGVVAEAGAPLGEPEPAAAGLQAEFRQLGHHLGHVPGRQELALFHIHAPGAARHRRRGGLEQIGLTAEVGGNLEHIHHLSSRCRLVAFVDVGEHRQGEALAHLLKNRQALLGPGPTERPAGAAVGLIEAGLEHVVDAEPLAELAHLIGDLQHEVAALDHAGAGDQAQGVAHGLPSPAWTRS